MICQIGTNIALAAAAAGGVAAQAAETISYRYDVHGRLVEVTRTGNPAAPAAAIVTGYTLDKAGNRSVKTTGGSPNPPPP